MKESEKVHTLQDLGLAIGVLARALHSTTVFEIQDDTVGKLLAILIRDVGRKKFGEREALR